MKKDIYGRNGKKLLREIFEKNIHVKKTLAVDRQKVKTSSKDRDLRDISKRVAAHETNNTKINHHSTNLKLVGTDPKINLYNISLDHVIKNPIKTHVFAKKQFKPRNSKLSINIQHPHNPTTRQQFISKGKRGVKTYIQNVNHRKTLVHNKRNYMQSDKGKKLYVKHFRGLI